jgi:hypothetical protein
MINVTLMKLVMYEKVIGEVDWRCCCCHGGRLGREGGVLGRRGGRGVALVSHGENIGIIAREGEGRLAQHIEKK